MRSSCFHNYFFTKKTYNLTGTHTRTHSHTPHCGTKIQAQNWNCAHSVFCQLLPSPQHSTSRKQIFWEMFCLLPFPWFFFSFLFFFQIKMLMEANNWESWKSVITFGAIKMAKKENFMLRPFVMSQHFCGNPSKVC